jgi:ubiquinone/menaquinone biosynthesis C-methylase UbiE
MKLGQMLHGTPHADAPGAIRHARAYELLSKVVYLGSRRRMFSRLVDLACVRPGDRVLDVGCGPGYLTALAAEAASPGGSALGIDPSEPMIEEGRRTRASANCSFEVDKAESLTAPGGSFDVVVSSLAVHHIPEDARGQAFAQVFRVLRPGGRVVLADFPPPRGRFGRHLVGATAGEVMRDNPVDRIAPMLVAAGFAGPVESRIGPFLHCVRAVKPD